MRGLNLYGLRENAPYADALDLVTGMRLPAASVAII